MMRVLVLIGLLTTTVAMSALPQPAAPARPAPPRTFEAHTSGVRPPARAASWPMSPKGGARPPARPAVAPGHTPLRNVSISVRVIAGPSPGPESTPGLAFVLGQNFPNPFAGSTTIRYSLPQAAPCRITVYSVTGQRLATLVDGIVEPGEYTLKWNGASDRGGRLHAGIYFCRMVAGTFVRSRKLVIE